MRVIYNPKDSTVGFEFDEKDTDARISAALRSIPPLIGTTLSNVPASKAIHAVAMKMTQPKEKIFRPLVITEGGRTKKGPGHVNQTLTIQEHQMRDLELRKFCELLCSKRNDQHGVFWKDAVKHTGREEIARSIYALCQHLAKHAKALDMNPRDIYASKDGVYTPGSQMSVFLERAFNITDPSSA